MKILFDGTELSYYLEENGHRAGVFFVALNLFREFRKKNIEIVLSCNFKRYYFLKEVISNIEEFKEIKLIKENDLINRFWSKLNYLARKAPLKIQYGVLSLSRYYENIFYRQNKKNIEQLRNFEYYFSPFTPASEEIMQASHIKRMMMLHDTIPIIEGEKIPTNKRLWCYRLYNTINEKDFYVTNSEQTKKDVLKYFPQVKESHVKTTLLGVNENFKPIKKTDDKKYVFSLCTLGKRKNLIFTIRNFFKFIEKNKIKDLYLVLGGGIWKKFEKELSETIENFDSEKIIMTGYIKDEGLPEWYSNALMFVYPSLYEGFGLPVLEAIKCGCPVITSNTSSLPEVIGDAGIKINPTCDEEIIKAFEKMYYDNFFRELCIERGLLRSEKFSWENCATEILDFIRKE